MGCRPSFTKARRSGLTLVELLVAMAVGGIITAVIAALVLYFSRALVTVINHIEIETQSQQALDTMSREVRSASSVTAITTNSCTLQVSSNRVDYAYHAGNRTLTRVERNALGVVLDTKVFLRECESASFEIFQRHAPDSNYEMFPAATTNNAKIVRLRWTMTREILGKKQCVETVNSARIVMRKKSS